MEGEPLRRPGSKPLDELNDSFMMDFENSVLKGLNSAKCVPKGKNRFEIDWWAAEVKKHVCPHHSDVDWYEYVEWVLSGGGDEWFQ
jgi:hypothetical protein